MPVQLHETEVIKAPLISEKSTFLANVKNAYTFVVDKKADKNQIRAAIEKLYNVKVIGVRTVNVAGKPKRPPPRRGLSSPALCADIRPARRGFVPV